MTTPGNELQNTARRYLTDALQELDSELERLATESATPAACRALRERILRLRGPLTELGADEGRPLLPELISYLTLAANGQLQLDETGVALLRQFRDAIPEAGTDQDAFARLSEIHRSLSAVLPLECADRWALLAARTLKAKFGLRAPEFALSAAELDTALGTEDAPRRLIELEFEVTRDGAVLGETGCSILSAVAPFGLVLGASVCVPGPEDGESWDTMEPLFHVYLATAASERELLDGVTPHPVALREADLYAPEIQEALALVRPGSALLVAAQPSVALKPTAKTAPAPPAPAPQKTSQATTPMTKQVNRPEARMQADKDAPKSTQPGAKKSRDTSIRVSLSVLDRLMTLAGELVLTRNQLLQSSGSDEAKSADATQRIDLVTTELQDAIMATRMQSIGIVFQRFRRVVRDLSNSLGKEVELVLEGEDVELDKTIIELIADPLMHLVRNALDHGLETPDVRTAHGKPERSRLRLSALHQAGHVVIEVEDDGRGIDPQKVKAKALERRLLSADQLDAMNDQALTKLIFRPGFSLAEKVTDLSGRGVGMDVVNTNLKKLGGVIDVDSLPGRGTLLRIKLPLTLAIIPCLLVTEEGETFAIPQTSLVELHRIPAREVKNKVQKLAGAHVMHLRGDLVPLIRLRDALGMEPHTYRDALSGDRAPDRRERIADRRGPSDADHLDERRSGGDRRVARDSAMNVAIVADGDFHFGIILESLQDSAEIVVKPLGRHLRDCTAYAGATILGNGRAALILDMAGLATTLKLRQLSGDERDDGSHADRESRADGLTVLLTTNGGDSLFAVPLGLVQRIERIRRDQLQMVSGRRTITYRGKILMLFTIDDVANVDPMEETETMYVIVYNVAGREVGLLVTNLVDIIDSYATIDDVTHRQEGIYGSMLVDERVVLLVDVQQLARSCMPEGTGFAHSIEGGGPSGANKDYSVLVVDDSAFFRQRLRDFLQSEGYDTLVAEDGRDAYEMLDANADRVNIVLTDIEMPHVDGFDLARRIRADARFQDLPIMAITSLMGAEAESRGREVGIDEYLIKLDPDEIRERTAHYLRHGRSA